MTYCVTLNRHTYSHRRANGNAKLRNHPVPDIYFCHHQNAVPASFLPYLILVSFIIIVDIIATTEKKITFK